MVSVIIAHRNEDFLTNVLDALMKNANIDKFEIIIIDDNSDTPLFVDKDKYPNVSVYYNKKQLGVGESFDIGVSKAKYEILVLMGADIIVGNFDWFKIALDYVEQYPQGIACSVCLSGDPHHLDPNNPANDTKRYGATIIPFALQDNLRTDSQIANSEVFYIGLFDNRWLKQKPEEIINEVPCVYGGMYITNKKWYNTIHGWDHEHKIWGNLEQWLSIKNYLYGGTCHVLCNLESLHIFEKFSSDAPQRRLPSGKIEYMWRNKIFLAYSVLPFSEALRLINKVYTWRVKYELPTRPFNLGASMVKKEWDNVRLVKERNHKSFTRTFDWFLEKFHINKNY